MAQEYARLAAAYKRSDLIFRRPEVIEPLLESGKVQIIFSGKAHPQDEHGKQIVANIRTLGFDPAQVKVLLNSHQHFDHAAGLAEIKRAAPGAKLYASAADGPVIAAGSSYSKERSDSVLSV